VHAKLEEAGVKIDKAAILLDEPISALGVFHVPVKLHAEVEAKVKVWVVKQAG
jgi:large subunit ribosomal protein L9